MPFCLKNTWHLFHQSIRLMSPWNIWLFQQSGSLAYSPQLEYSLTTSDVGLQLATTLNWSFFTAYLVRASLPSCCFISYPAVHDTILYNVVNGPWSGFIHLYYSCIVVRNYCITKFIVLLLTLLFALYKFNFIWESLTTVYPIDTGSNMSWTYIWDSWSDVQNAESKKWASPLPYVSA